MSKEWSVQQKEIFNWFESSEGNLIVRARAGTGKTTTIIEGIGHAPEKSILLAAFNKRIQEELNMRLSNPNAVAKTLHAVGFSCVRRFWEGLKVASGNDRQDALTAKVCGPSTPDAIKRLVSKLHTKGREIAPHAREIGDLTDIAYAFDCDPDESWTYDGFGITFVETKALEAMELAATVKPVDTGVDFSDMIFLPVRNKWLTKQFDMVVVDEAQDMTIAQLEIAVGVCRGRVCVVGDDRQAIYGFRGADSESLDRLKKQLDAKELGLTTTYRCGKSITAAAARLVPDIQAAPTSLFGEVLSIKRIDLVATADKGDFILSRLNAPLVSVAMSLLKNQKRAAIAGRDIGAGLKSLIRRLSKGRAANSVPEFLIKVGIWEDKEVARMTAAKRPAKAEAIRDQADMLRSLALEAKSVPELESRIDVLFSDDGLGTAGVVTCSSVHRAKGLEADKVFILRDTLYPNGRMNTEEQNIEYVAITRAKSTLVWVEGK